MYVMNVGLDLRLVDTNTLEVVDVISYQKQIIGRQVQAGVFDFLGSTFFDAAPAKARSSPFSWRTFRHRARRRSKSSRVSITRNPAHARPDSAQQPIRSPVPEIVLRKWPA